MVAEVEVQLRGDDEQSPITPCLIAEPAQPVLTMIGVLKSKRSSIRMAWRVIALDLPMPVTRGDAVLGIQGFRQPTIS